MSLAALKKALADEAAWYIGQCADAKADAKDDGIDLVDNCGYRQIVGDLVNELKSKEDADTFVANLLKMEAELSALSDGFAAHFGIMPVLFSCSYAALAHFMSPDFTGERPVGDGFFVDAMIENALSKSEPSLVLEALVPFLGMRAGRVVAGVDYEVVTVGDVMDKDKTRMNPSAMCVVLKNGEAVFNSLRFDAASKRAGDEVLSVMASFDSK